jgi:hypothetical protein
VSKSKWQHVSALCEQATKHLKINFKNKERKYTIFIVVPYILKSKASHLATDALFITLGKV